jgi:hypothetical protein
MATFLVLGALTLWWVLASANVFWMQQDNPLRLSLYTKLAPESLAKFAFNSDSGISIDLTLHPGMTGRIRSSFCPASKPTIVNNSEQLKTAVRSTRHPVFCEYPSMAQEATVFYYRYPYFSSGTVKSLGYQVEVLGKTETRFVPGTVDMSRFFDRALEKMPELSGGRFEVVLLDGIEGAKEGKGIQIVDLETFPVGSPDEAFDSTDGVFRAALKSARRIRTWLMQLWIGIYNVMAGNQINVFRLIFKIPQLVRRAHSCGSGSLKCLLGSP